MSESKVSDTCSSICVYIFHNSWVLSHNKLLLKLFSIFEENSGGRGGVVSIAYLSVAFGGTNKFHKNSGYVLLVRSNKRLINFS